MASARYDSVWELMRRKDFILIAAISDEHKCIICKNLLINACSAPCGCRFCMDCIQKYLDGRDRSCPGETENCREEVITLVRDIQLDHAINTRIAKVLVRCPQQSCDFRDELRRMEDHVRGCKTRKVRCPFMTVGCVEGHIAIDRVDDHLAQHGGTHARQLMACVDGLRAELRTLTTELAAVKRDAELRQAATLQLEADKVHNSVRLAMLEQRLKEVASRDEVVDMRTATLDKDGLKKCCVVVDPLPPDRKRKHVGGGGDGDEGSCELKIAKIESFLANGGNGNGNDDEGPRETEFLWTVDKFSEKRRSAQNALNAEIYSEPFYSRRNGCGGYKLRLVLCPYGSGAGKGTHLSVFFQVMRGEYDAALAWPMRDKVTVAVASHDTGLGHVIRHYRHDSLPDKVKVSLHQPKAELNNSSCGNPKFFCIESLLANTALYRNDQILLKCSVQTEARMLPLVACDK